MQKVFIVVIACWLFPALLFSQPKHPKVMVMEIKSEIDAPMKRYVKLALEHGEKIKADYVVVDMNTYGGGLTDAIDIVQLLLNYPKPVWVFINSNAASAGAFISIACDSIYMSSGASIGAATVVEGGSGAAAPDKYQSYMRSKMRAAAIANHRNPRIAEGMVDENIVIDSLKPEGKVLTFTTEEAIKVHYCEAQVNSIAEILERNKIKDYELTTFHLSAADTVVAFFMNPFISGILILIILAGLYFEFQTPGASFPIIVAFAALVLYLVPYYLNGLAEYWEIILLFVGILLLIAEVFIIPGFGVAGVTGIVLTVGSLILIMVKNDFFNFDGVPMGDLLTAGFVVIGGLSGGIVVLFFGGARLTQSKAFRRFALTDTQQASHGFTVNNTDRSLIGKIGMASTVLRPSGKVMINQQIYDAFTRGEYIEKGSPVIVISTEGISLQVKSQE